MATINPGFRGFAEVEVGGLFQKLRFNTCSLNATQDVEAPDMVMGDETHNAWAYGKIEVAGTISGPMTESTGSFITLLDSVTGTEAGALIHVKYYDGFARTFEGCQLNSFSFTVTAGELVTFNLDIIGERIDPAGGPALPDVFTKGEKLITWDKAVMRVGDLTEDDVFTFASVAELTGLQSFTFNASNNISRQFVVSESSLFGDLVEGMKSVTGSIVSYTDKTSEDLGDAFARPRGADFWGQYEGDFANPIEFDLGADLRVQAAIRFHRSTADLGVGPVVASTNFTGVTTFGKASLTTP